MFVRNKYNQSGSVSIQIIKKINHTNKVIKTIGSSKYPNEVGRLYHKGLHEIPRLFGATLFDQIQKLTIKELSNVIIRIVDHNLFLAGFFITLAFRPCKIPYLRI